MAPGDPKTLLEDDELGVELNPTRDPQPLVGMRLNNIELVSPLDAGGMGVIYVGVNRELDKRYAVKVATQSDPSLAARALAEAQALSTLDHPNIVQIFDASTLADGRLAIVMPLLSGESLQRRLDRSKRLLSVHEVVHLSLQLAAGLGAAHQKGFVHRDLKPGNVFITQHAVELEGCRAPEVKLLDFGLVRVQRGQGPEAAPKGAPARLTTIRGGTPQYASPEQVRGTAAIDGRADLYSLGVLLFELLAGRPPFVADARLSEEQQVVALLTQHLNEAAPRVTVFAPDVPAPLAELIGQLLEKAPEKRPQTASEVESRLRDVLAGLSRLPLPARPKSAPVALMAGLGAALLLVLAGAAVAVATSSPPPAIVPLPPPAVTRSEPPAAPLPVDEPQVPPPPPPTPAPPPPDPVVKPPLKRPAKARPVRECTPDEAWRRHVLADLNDLGRLAQEDSTRYAKFKAAEARLSGLVRSAVTPRECGEAQALLEQLKVSLRPR